MGKTRTTLVQIRAGNIRKGILLPFSCWLWWELAACLPWSATVVPPKATCGPVLFLSSRLSVVHQSNCSRGKSWCTLWGCFTLRSLVPSCQKGHRAKGFVSVSRVPVTVLILLLAPRSSMPVSSPRKNLMVIMLSIVLMYTINLVTIRILLLTLMCLHSRVCFYMAAVGIDSTSCKLIENRGYYSVETMDTVFSRKKRSLDHVMSYQTTIQKHTNDG